MLKIYPETSLYDGLSGEQGVSSVRCATGDGIAAMRCVNPLSPFVTALVFFLALHAFLAPSGAAVSAAAGLAGQHSYPEDLRVRPEQAVTHAAVETIRRMATPAMRNADSSSALVEIGRIAAEFGAPAPFPGGADGISPGLEAMAPARAPPAVANNWA